MCNATYPSLTGHEAVLAEAAKPQAALWARVLHSSPHLDAPQVEEVQAASHVTNDSTGHQRLAA